jgi:hypothetical protein
MENMKFSITVLLLISMIFIYTGCGDTPVEETTGTIEGIVYDFTTGDIIGKANVKTDPPSSSVTTDSITGEYKILHVDPGIYRVTAEKTGYDTSGVSISVIAGEATVADVTLKYDSIQVDTTQNP